MPTEETQHDTHEIVVFSIVRESVCSECSRELQNGSFLRKEGDGVLCLGCADLEHLEFLPRGDAALTRRARKHSELDAVVVRFSRTRKRYERQGVLVQSEALERAERECLEDAEARRRRRQRDAERRARQDAAYITAFAEHIRSRYPQCPNEQRTRIAAHACEVHSGRIGRTAGAKEFDGTAIDLAVQAHARHNHTAYDRLLSRGLSRSDARAHIAQDLERVLASWRDS